MAQARADLLALACDRIRYLDRPAYIKDHMLRYVAANDAYLKLVGLGRDVLSGYASFRDRARENGEIHTLSIGDDQRFPLLGRDGAPVGEAEVERFITDDGQHYLFGQVTPLGGHDAARDLDLVRQALEYSAQPIRIVAPDGRVLIENEAHRAGPMATAPVAAPTITVKKSVEDALEMLDVGFAVFDPQDRLIYRNRQMEALYGPVIGPLRSGLTLGQFYAALYDAAEQVMPPEKMAAFPPREDWVSQRLSMCGQAHAETTEQTCDGRWLRSINRRLENGLLMLVRLDVTDLKKQELLLRQHVDQNELYHSIIEEMPVAVYARSSDHRMVFVNAAFCSLFGHERENLLGRTEVESYGENGISVHASNEMVLKAGVAASFEEMLHHASGEKFAAMTRTSCVTTETGEAYVVGSVIDISELKARETALREAQSRAETLTQDLGAILNALPAGVLVFDEHLRVEYVNESLYGICNLPASVRLQGEPVHRAIEIVYDHARPAAGDGSDLAERLSLLFERGVEASIEFTSCKGRSVIAVARNLGAGKTLVTFADISDLRQQEREITETQHQLESIGQIMHNAARVMSQGLFVVQDGVIILSNAAASDMMCVPPELVAPGRRWSDCFEVCIGRGDFGAVEEARAMTAGWPEIMREKGTLTHSFMAAGRRWVQFIATLGQGGQVMVVFNDLTEMKQREAELERLLARSEAADRAKSEFLANMGHEIRTPINGVLGMAELLGKTDLDARQRTFTEIISKSATTLLTIFNDILDFSKIDSGQMQLKPAPFDPMEALEDICTLHSAAAAEKNLELLLRVGEGLPQRVVGDAGRFRQIVANFVSNAIRHTESGHVLIDVSAGKRADGRIDLSVAVEDTGVGVEPEKLRTIFDKFAQSGLSEQRHGEGTGLGLAITAGLVSLFGGRVEAQSEPGVGSTFTVSLPLAVDMAARPLRPVPANVAGARILLIDDYAPAREIVLAQLASWGFDCHAAETPEEAREIIEAASAMGVPVNAVLIDDQWSAGAGAGFCRWLRARPARETIALILLTAFDAAGDISRFERLQAQAHVAKPIRANILRNTVIEVLRAAQARAVVRERAEATGNAFAALLPEAEAEFPADPAETLAVVPPVQPRIVVAEDNEVNAFVFSQILDAAGHHFVLAANGEEAIAHWQKYQPAVILMDVNMPVMDGLEATRRIRHMERVADLPPVAIIAVTAHDTESGRELCLSHGMDDYLAKPISPEALEEKLERWLGARRRMGQPAE